jgi:hypothetical protein
VSIRAMAGRQQNPDRHEYRFVWVSLGLGGGRFQKIIAPFGAGPEDDGLSERFLAAHGDPADLALYHPTTGRVSPQF